MLLSISFFIILVSSLFSQTAPLFREPNTGVEIPCDDSYLRMEYGPFYLGGIFYQNGFLFNNYFKTHLDLSSYQAVDLKELIKKFQKKCFRKAALFSDKEGWNIYSIQKSDPDLVWYFQFYLSSDDEVLKPAKRGGVVVRKVNDLYFVASFEMAESDFISGERWVLRLLEKCRYPNSDFASKYSALMPYLTVALKEVPSNDSLWQSFKKRKILGSRSIFYRLEDGDNTVYLLGSVHAGQSNFFPLPAKVMNAFEGCSKLVFEAVPEGNAVWELQNYSTRLEKYRTGRNLLTLISKEEYQKLKNLVSSKVFTISDKQLLYQKPWVLYTFVSSMMLLDSGISAEYGIENYFYRIKKPEVELLGLEEVKYHISVFDRIDYHYWLGELFQIDSIESKEELGLMMEKWKAGDLDYFGSQVDQDKKNKHSSYHFYMLKDRNRTMAESIKSFLKTDEDYFVIAGSAHFGGEDSIINLLIQEGYAPMQIECGAITLKP